jgi:two-component system, NtrC family, response regulator AtoC
MMKSEECKKRILVVDDEENLRHMLQVMLRKHGYLVDTATDGNEAFRMASENDYAFILCDIRMPVMDGAGFLKKAAAAGISGTIIMMSAYGTVDTAIECMKQGAYDYISKPFKNDEILLVLKKAEERERLKIENKRLKEEIGREYSFASMVSRNRRMQEIFSLIKKVCDFKTTVLILGESGTGKAIPENLLESELFGHVKGAFTDASSEKAGLFEQADGGTLFLDEIGEMPLPLQVKLLRVLQEGEIRRVGASVSRKVDVRVISATSKNLEAEVARSGFREDLYFRLNVLSIVIPPLRERLEDLPLLLAHFLEKYGEDLEKQGMRCPAEVMQVFMHYAWPGNIREFENCIQRILLLSDGDILDAAGLPDHLQKRPTMAKGVEIPLDAADDAFSIKRASERMEKEMIRRALAETGGNRTHAARLLEISHRSLLYKLKEYGIE